MTDNMLLSSSEALNNKGKLSSKKQKRNSLRTLVLNGLAAIFLWIIINNNNIYLHRSIIIATTTGMDVVVGDNNIASSSGATAAAVVAVANDQQQQEEEEEVAAAKNKNNDAHVLEIIKELYDAVSTERLSKLAKQYKRAYYSAQPFPHIAIDGIFPEKYLQLVLNENPESNIIDGCLHGNSDGCFKASQENMKSAIDVEESMGFYTRLLFGIMKSSTFVQFLEELSSIQHIIPDPHYEGSGMHFTASGGHLDIHADFNNYERYRLHRRVNALLYLNDNWLPEYGGNLELWSNDMKECTQKILPTLGRLVIFSTTDFSYHGHPQPLSCPPDRVRRSLAVYYYTRSRPNSECLNNTCEAHSTLFQKPVGCTTCEETTCYHVNVPIE